MIARDVGRAGYSVTSGLARGIDTAAHRASVETGTIAVLARGLDQPHPPENIPLLEEITQGNGLAISEMPFRGNREPAISPGETASSPASLSESSLSKLPISPVR
jgi:predicted Rossmann fold nucleotide-binding protein DprA/Smf involved in DNA uptake